MSGEINSFSNMWCDCSYEEEVVECNSLVFKENHFLKIENVKHKRDLKNKIVKRSAILEKMYAPIPLTTFVMQDFQKLIPETLKDKFTGNFSSMVSRTIHGHTVFTAADRGSKPRMEDTFVSTLLKFEEHNIQIPTFMLFDGHGGSKCSDYLARKFYKILTENLKRVSLSNEVQIKFAFKAAFLEADVRFNKKHPNLFSGSTAIIAAIINDILFVANAGDSRAILTSCNQTFQLSEDAVCTEEPFKSSIVKRNGKPRYYYNEYKRDKDGRICLKQNGDLMPIKFVSGEKRPYIDKAEVDINNNPVKIPVLSRYEKSVVCNGRIRSMYLAPGRTIGDIDFHEVSARPKVKAFDLKQLDPNATSFLILACDGVWDVMNSEEVSATVQNEALKHTEDESQTKEVANAILNEAFLRDSQDNVSVMAIKLFIPAQEITSNF